MPTRSAVLSLRARLARWFFSHFGSLLVGAVSIAQWAVLCWVAGGVASAGWTVHLVGPALLYAGNRSIAIRAEQRRARHAGPASAAQRGYYAVAFTSLFAGVFLLATAAVWGTAKVLVGALVVEASTHAGTVARPMLDGVFTWFANLGLATIAGSFLYGYTIGQRRLSVTTVAAPIRALPPALAGFRIVQISDIHIGQNLTVNELQRFVSRVNALEPDLVCVTGDIADAPGADLETFVPVLGRLQAPHGVIAILGNHDHYAGADRVAGALRRLTPITVLRDERAVVRVGDAALYVLGLDDRGRDWARGLRSVPQLDRLLDGLPANAPIVLLSHRPDVFPQAAARGVALTLAGHTHGGQLALPALRGRPRNLAQFITDFPRGLYETDGTWLYVNAGLGVTGQRIRLGTPREITVIELAPAGAEQQAA